MKDWIGNKKSVFTTLGASSHALEEREKYDYYATDPRALQLLLELETFDTNILEPCCGEGHLSEVLISSGYNVTSYDLIQRDYKDMEVKDFLNEVFEPITEFVGDIITNPPYSLCNEFVEKSLSIIPTGNKVAMFMKMTFVEGKKRREFLKQYPIKTIYVSSSRINCPKNGDFAKSVSSAVCYAWFIWEKGYAGSTELRWFN